MARTLSAERLTLLHHQALPFATGDGWSRPVPPVFDDLGVVTMGSYFNDSVRLKLRGCMDHSIALIVYADQPHTVVSEARVELLYAEHPPVREILLLLPRSNSELIAIRYSRDNGSLPPPHRRSTLLEVRADGSATLEKLRGYKREPGALNSIDFEVDPVVHRQLSERIAELGLLSREILAAERHPVGGGTVQLCFSGTGGEVRFPRFPADPADVELRDGLASAVKALIPERLGNAE